MLVCMSQTCIHACSFLAYACKPLFSWLMSIFNTKHLQFYVYSYQKMLDILLLKLAYTYVWVWTLSIPCTYCLHMLFTNIDTFYILYKSIAQIVVISYSEVKLVTACLIHVYFLKYSLFILCKHYISIPLCVFTSSYLGAINV